MADLNALIAQGYQPQAQIDPFAQYAKMQQLNVGQNQNALAQYQLAQAQRADVQANTLNAAYASGINPDTGEMDYGAVRRSLAAGGAGSQIPALEKSRLEQQTAALNQKELLGKIAAQPVALAKARTEAVDAQLKQSKERLNQIDPTAPDAREQLLAWHQSNHEGLLGDTLRASGSTPEQTQGAINAAVAKGPAGIADFIQKSTLGQTEFAKSIAPIPEAATDGKTKFFIDKNQRSPTFGQKIGGQGFAVGVSPDVSARLAQEAQGVTYQQDAEGNIVAVPSRLPAGVAPVARPVIGEAGVPIKGRDSTKTAVSEQQAASNIGRLLTAANQIKDIAGKDASSVKPGVAEALASSVGMSGTANLVRPANRQIVQGAQRDALDALLYLATGAAYTKEQLVGQMDAYIPAYTDKPENVIAKQVRMTNLIQSAKARAGKAWTPEMDTAMKSLTSTGMSSDVSGKVTPAAPAAGAGEWKVVK